MNFKGKSALVTGVTGFVGSKVAERFHHRGIKVRGLVRKQAKLQNIEPVLGDLADPASLEHVAKGVDYIAHCAVGSAELEQDFESAIRVNVEGTRSLIESARSYGVERFVQISSCGAYNLDGVPLVTEQTPLWDLNDERVPTYGRFKAEVDRLVLESCKRGLPGVILRPPNILGTHPRSVWGYKIPKWIKDGEGEIYGNGKNSWPVVSIHNLLDAIESALITPEVVGREYTIVDSHTTWEEYTQRIAGWMGVELNQADPDWPWDFFYGQFSTERAHRELGYKPKISYDQAMEEIHQYLIECGLIEKVEIPAQ